MTLYRSFVKTNAIQGQHICTQMAPYHQYYATCKQFIDTGEENWFQYLLRAAIMILYTEMFGKHSPKMGYHFQMFAKFWYGGLCHLGLYCTWTIEV